MIKQKTNVKLFVLAAAASFGLVASAVAQSVPAAASVTPEGGLLGQNYAGVGLTYVHYDKGLPKLAHDYGFFFNQALTDGLDLGVNYDYTRATTAGVGLSNYTAGLDLTGYVKQGWGKPFLTAGAGWMWVRGGSSNDNSYAYRLATGIEFAVTPAFSVAPIVSYQAAPNIIGQHEWDYGIKANYRLTKEWSVSASVTINEHKDTGYGVGVNYFF